MRRRHTCVLKDYNCIQCYNGECLADRRTRITCRRVKQFNDLYEAEAYQVIRARYKEQCEAFEEELFRYFENYTPRNPQNSNK